MTTLQQVQLTPEQMEALLNSLSTETGEARSPLLDFEGKCVDIQGTMESRKGFDNTIRNVLKLKYMFDKVKVHDSRTPYSWETAELVFYNNDTSQVPQPTNPYGIWVQSMTDIMGVIKLPAIKGHTLRVTWLPATRVRMNQETKEFDEYEGEAFKVVSIDGKNNPTLAGISPGSTISLPPTQDINDLLADLADGKVREGQGGFSQAALQNDVIKGNNEVFNNILSNNGSTVLAQLVEQGKLSLDGETYRNPPITT